MMKDVLNYMVGGQNERSIPLRFKRRRSIRFGTPRLLVIVGILILSIVPTVLQYQRVSKKLWENKSLLQLSGDSIPMKKKCAILFWGLPRAFVSLVLPSIQKHILETNAKYECDYYIHYFEVDRETAGRSGSGGVIHSSEILTLQDAIFQVAKNHKQKTMPIVSFGKTTITEFLHQYQPLLDKISKTKVDGKHLYFPWKARTYKNPDTTDNIIKMWHTIQSAYQLMEQSNIQYETIAMLRNDVVYVTPIDVLDGPDPMTSTIPNFGKYPVSDRAIYGPAAAVKIWATQRFAKLEEHAEFIQKHDPGWGLHSERFVNYALLPAIRQFGAVREHPDMCFFRARADESVWISDCDVSSGVQLPQPPRIFLEQALGRSCPGKIVRLTRTVQSLDCSSGK